MIFFYKKSRQIIFVYYTGNDKSNGRKSSQCLAISDDGENFQKIGVILETPKNFTEHFRDPKIHFDGKNFEIYIGVQKIDGKGAIVFSKSADGKNFGEVKTIGESKNFEMIECPNAINFGEEKILLYCLQKRDNILETASFSESVYKIFDDGDLDNFTAKVDSGFDFYAPQIFETSDGRKIMFAWMSRLSDLQEKILSDCAENIHCLTMPREIFLRDRKIFQKPIREMYKLIGEKICAKKIPEHFI